MRGETPHRCFVTILTPAFSLKGEGVFEIASRILTRAGIGRIEPENYFFSSSARRRWRDSVISQIIKPMSTNPNSTYIS